jgi:hypothetical protein
MAMAIASSAFAFFVVFFVVFLALARVAVVGGVLALLAISMCISVYGVCRAERGRPINAKIFGVQINISKAAATESADVAETSERMLENN